MAARDSHEYSATLSIYIDEMSPSIDPRIAAVAPDFRALSIVVDSGALVDGARAGQELELAYRAVARNEPAWAAAHLEAWAEAFRRFGAKPQRTPCSAEALRKRVLRDGALPRVSPVVDLYNAISLRFAVPVGGETLDAYAGRPLLTVATGAEDFDTMKDGQPAVEHPEPGEVVWRDDRAVTCRRWNWRQGVRTRLGADARRMWFILESLGPMPLEALHEAGGALGDGLRAMMPAARIEATLISASAG
jgi:DNA/RNA-binding domain of Phe-tRNA-synthetase-like protein